MSPKPSTQCYVTLWGFFLHLNLKAHIPHPLLFLLWLLWQDFFCSAVLVISGMRDPNSSCIMHSIFIVFYHWIFLLHSPHPTRNLRAIVWGKISDFYLTLDFSNYKWRWLLKSAHDMKWNQDPFHLNSLSWQLINETVENFQKWFC